MKCFPEDAAMNNAVQDLCRFIDASPSPYHAAETVLARLREAGFKQLELTNADWPDAPGRYVVRRSGSVVAWVARGKSAKRFALIGAHTDSPNLRLKPNAAYACEGYKQFGIEIYGGVLLNSWLDRDLGCAGTVHLADGSVRALRIDKPLARVPQLAIHLDRKVNDDGLKLNPQTHLAPIWGLGGTNEESAAVFSALIAQAAGVSPKDIVAHDLSLFDLTKCATGGANDELLFAPRLDNLASCHAGLQALLASAEKNSDSLPVLALFDHEEVGSASTSGASGPLLESVLERIDAGLSRSQHLSRLAGSLMLSADMAHAVHPNYAEKHEPRHKPQLGRGPVLKSNTSQRYATSAESAAAVRRLAKSAGVALQDFVTRCDIGCGSTIGPITATRLGIAVADLGNPMLSMHSARECAASADHEPFIRLLAAHLSA
jgi:aspartyl aminopeptidase